MTSPRKVLPLSITLFFLYPSSSSFLVQVQPAQSAAQPDLRHRLSSRTHGSGQSFTRYVVIPHNMIPSIPWHPSIAHQLNGAIYRLVVLCRLPCRPHLHTAQAVAVHAGHYTAECRLSDRRSTMHRLLADRLLPVLIIKGRRCLQATVVKCCALIASGITRYRPYNYMTIYLILLPPRPE